LNAVFEAEKPNLLALDDDSLRAPRVGRERAQEQTDHLIKEFGPLLGTVDEKLKEGPAAEVKRAYSNLDRKSDVYYAADLASETPWTPEQKRRLYELIPRNKEHDTYLFDWAWPLFKNNPEILPILINIREGTGFKDDGEDVVRLVDLFQKNWELAAGKTPVTEAYLAEAERDATEQLRLLRQQGRGKGSPPDMRWRAYTSWAEDYELVADTGRYLARKDPNRNQRFPGIYPERGTTAATGTAAPAPAATTETPTDGPSDTSETNP
jgi:hypothetical protein